LIIGKIKMKESWRNILKSGCSMKTILSLIVGSLDVIRIRSFMKQCLDPTNGTDMEHLQKDQKRKCALEIS
jgi:hypothetical protein